MSYSPYAHTTATTGRLGLIKLSTGVSADASGALVTTSVPSGVTTSGSYADPSWITSLAASKVGLGNVTNESKATMFTSPTFTGTVNGVTKTHVGLGNVDNTSDASKSVSYASTAGRAYPYRSDGGNLNFYYSAQSGQPTALWGGNDGVNMYVYDPANFSVNYATSAGTAGSATTAGTAGTVTTAAQPNITSLGNLTSATVTGILYPNGIQYTRYGYTSVATSGGTTNIGGATNDSKARYIFTGSSNQTVVMPLYNNGTNVVAEYYIINNSTGVLAVQDVVGFALTNVPPGASVTITSTGQQAAGIANWLVSYNATGYSLGCGSQNWSNATSARAFNTTYTNSTYRPIMISPTLQSNGTHFDADLMIYVDNVMVARNGPSSGATGLGSVFSTAFAVVPAGSTYKALTGSYGTTLFSWFELR